MAQVRVPAFHILHTFGDLGLCEAFATVLLYLWLKDESHILGQGIISCGVLTGTRLG